MSERKISSRSFVPLLSVRVQHRFERGGEPALDMYCALEKPWTVLFGPSGAGKSTVLRTIAGVLRPDAARVIFQGDVWTDTAAHVFVPPHKRGIGYVGQQSTLFPHLSVLENVQFGIRAQADGAERARTMLALFHADDLIQRRVHSLSGGERQRILLARALAPAPRLLLLDEPFTGLDYALRETLLEDLKSYLAEHPTPVLSVTHDVSEVFTVDADVVVMQAGRIVRSGTPSIVLHEERAAMLRALG